MWRRPSLIPCARVKSMQSVVAYLTPRFTRSPLQTLTLEAWHTHPCGQSKQRAGERTTPPSCQHPLQHFRALRALLLP